jgi:hypothetical protein
MKPISVTVFLALLSGVAALGSDQSDREKLIGSWELAGAPLDSLSSYWTFSEQGESIRVTQQEGTTKVANFQCHTDGASCDVKVSGKRAMVSLWFNGAKLVELETKGSEVLKRRFEIISQGDGAGEVMEMELIPIVPAEKTEIFRYKRLQQPASDSHSR